MTAAMGLAETLAVLMVVAVCIVLFAGYPVALTLGGVSLAFAAFGHVFGVMHIATLGALPARVFGVMTNDVLVAIPLFIFMGVMLERSQIAEQLLDAMGRLFGSLRGGLGISVMIVGALLAASTGIVGATAVTLGLTMLPAMLRCGYDPRLAAGTVAASATLAQIIPPSTVLVVLGDQLNNAYQAAQLAQGTFAPSAVSVGDLFAGALLPGFLLVGFYILYQVVVAIVRPDSSPAVPPTRDEPAGLALVRKLSEVLLAPMLLIVAVLGSILGGLATPTEAASVGAIGSILLAARKVRTGSAWAVALAAAAIIAVLALGALTDVRLGRGAGLLDRLGISVALVLIAATALGAVVAIVSVWRAGILVPVMAQTTQITSMIFVILIGATLFSLVFRALGGDDLVHRALADLPGGVAGAIIVVMIAIFLLGFVMDAFEIIFVVVPIVAPALLKMPGVDPVWLGILIAVNLQTSYIHPPLGPTLFYLRGVAPPEITTRHIYVGIIPFVLIQLVALVVLWFVPELATALPRALYGG
jgi:tripartite ATP-independent transporter DctM subunit